MANNGHCWDKQGDKLWFIADITILYSYCMLMGCINQLTTGDGGFHKWFIREHPFEIWMILGYPHLWKPPHHVQCMVDIPDFLGSSIKDLWYINQTYIKHFC